MSPKKCILIKSALITKTLKTRPKQGGRVLEPLGKLFMSGILPGTIIEDVRVWREEAELHLKEDDFWICLEGKAKFLYGGKLIKPYRRKNSDGSVMKNHLFSKKISGGSRIVLKPFDVFLIPAGQPHQHGSDGVARLAVIKIPAKIDKR